MNPFDRLTQRYDQWFDTTRGRVIFEAEVGCLQDVIRDRTGRWLEVGVGTGRFAEALHVAEGVDPSRPMLRVAQQRGIRVRPGPGEALPYPDGAFHGVLMVVTVCFLADPARAFGECFRVLREDGCLALGFVPADSPWGKLYARRGRKGHPFYAAARFYTCPQVLALCAAAGFALDRAVSCLLAPPGKPVDSALEEGIVAGAGFVGMRFRKTPE